jgi:hypothetical protein
MSQEVRGGSRTAIRPILAAGRSSPESSRRIGAAGPWQLLDPHGLKFSPVWIGGLKLPRPQEGLDQSPHRFGPRPDLEEAPVTAIVERLRPWPSILGPLWPPLPH